MAMRDAIHPGKIIRKTIVDASDDDRCRLRHRLFQLLIDKQYFQVLMEAKIALRNRTILQKDFQMILEAAPDFKPKANFEDEPESLA